jgi:hypothetical protein
VSIDDIICQRARELAAELSVKEAAEQSARQLIEDQTAEHQRLLADKSRTIGQLCAQYVAWLRRNRIKPILVYEWPHKKKGWYVGTHRLLSFREGWDRELAKQRSSTITLDEALYVDRHIKVYDRKANTHEYGALEEAVLIEVISGQVSKLGRSWP